MRFATWETEGRVQAGVVGTAGLHALPGGTTVLDLVRAGLPAALEAGSAALDGPGPPPDRARPPPPRPRLRPPPPLQPPTVRDFVSFEEHVEGVRKSIDGQAGVVAEWYQA